MCDDDNVDEDCNGVADNDDRFPLKEQEFSEDADGDGYSGSGPTTEACDPPDGYAALSGDCDDDDDAVHPGAEVLCDDIDNDCDGEVDVGAVGPQWYVDDDGDGFGGEPGGTTCEPARGEVDESGDCDNANRRINPDADEVCNGVDDDCDGVIDDEDPSLDSSGGDVFYTDADNDGYGDASAPVVACRRGALSARAFKFPFLRTSSGRVTVVRVMPVGDTALWQMS